MNNDRSNIRPLVTAEYIRRYLAGELDDAAMHALEKQSLSDPFLAEALEGYADHEPDQSTQLADLEARLLERLTAEEEQVFIAASSVSPAPMAPPPVDVEDPVLAAADYADEQSEMAAEHAYEKEYEMASPKKARSGADNRMAPAAETASGKVRRFDYRWAVAASVLLLLAIGGYEWLQQGSTDKVAPIAQQTKIPPASEDTIPASSGKENMPSANAADALAKERKSDARNNKADNPNSDVDKPERSTGADKKITPPANAITTADTHFGNDEVSAAPKADVESNAYNPAAPKPKKARLVVSPQLTTYAVNPVPSGTTGPLAIGKLASPAKPLAAPFANNAIADKGVSNYLGNYASTSNTVANRNFVSNTPAKEKEVTLFDKNITPSANAGDEMDKRLRKKDESTLGWAGVNKKPTGIDSMLAGRLSGVVVASAPQNAGITSLSPNAASNVPRIGGQVVDESNNAIPGAIVRYKGSSTGVQTDAKGFFNLSADSAHRNQPIQISMIGYTSKDTMLYATSGTRPIQLKQSSSALNDVVVVGYGTSKRNEAGSDASNYVAPTPRTGYDSLHQYLDERLQNINAPAGKLRIIFTVTPTGDLRDIHVLSGISDFVDSQVVEFLKEGPAWNPASDHRPAKVKIAVKVQSPKR